MVKSLPLCVDSRLTNVICCVVRGVRLKSGQGPFGGSAIPLLVVALLLRMALYRTGIGCTGTMRVMLSKAS